MDSSQREAADLLAHSVLLALSSSHRHLALIAGKAMRYPAEIAPFAALQETSDEAIADLKGFLAPNESIYLAGKPGIETPGLRWDGVVPCLQMLWPAELAIPKDNPSVEIENLDCSNADEMVELIRVAFPGYFRSSTCRMGQYYGVRKDGRLIAMGGERLVFEYQGRTWREISGLCTHPEHAGKGLGTALLLHILRQQKAAGAISWLHVAESNTNAIRLYERLGFRTVQRVELHRFVREA